MEILTVFGLVFGFILSVLTILLPVFVLQIRNTLNRIDKRLEVIAGCIKP